MNKRVWSIAVALVMLLSMVCSAFAVSAADEVLQIALSSENVSEGDALEATVQLNNYASDWNDLAIRLDYDPSMLEIVSVDTSGFGADGSYAEEQKGVLEAKWSYEEAVVKEETAFDAMKISFKVIGAEGASSLKAALQAGEVTAEAQAAFQIENTFELSLENSLLAADGTGTTLALTPSATAIVIGSEFDVAVSLENYTGDWATFTATLTYDSSAVQYRGYEEAENAAFIVANVEEADGALTITWLSATDENVTATGAALALLNLKFKALAEGDSALTAVFADESVAGYDANLDPVFIDASAYNTAEVSSTVSITKKTPYLTLHWAGDSVTEIKQGDQIKAYVTLNDYYEGWMMMNLSVAYDAAIFELTDAQALDAFADDAMEMLTTEPSVGTLNVCFFNGDAENALLKADADGNAVYKANILELTFTARANAEGTGEISTSFGAGNYKYDAAADEEIELTQTEDYTVTHEDGTVEVSVIKISRPSLSTKLVDSEGNEITSVKQGESFKLQVYIKDFDQAWSMMSLIAKFDNTVFEVDEAAVEAANPNEELLFGDYMVSVLSGGTLGVTLLDGNGDDVGLTGDVTEGVILTIPMTVKSGIVLDEDSFPIDVYFAPEGNMSGGEVVDTLYYDNYDESTAAKADVAIQGQPYVTIERVVADGEDASAVVKQGDEVEFAVYANDFINAWQIMTLRVTFDSKVFQLVPDSATDSEPFDTTSEYYQFIPEEGTSALLACWFNDVDMSMKDKTKQQVMTFKLKAKEGVDLTDEEIAQIISEITVAFEPSGNYQGGAEVSADAYIATPGTVQVTVEEVELEIFVNITWGAMEFTYNFGTWDPNGHVWDGRGWSVANDADKTITVTNQGGVAVTAEFAFAESLTGMVGTFYDSENAEVTQLTIAAPADGVEGVSEAVTLGLGELPDGAELSTTEKTPLGTITITIDKADS